MLRTCPEELTRKLPRFPLPVTLLGRMAVSQSSRGQGFGEFLLMHALEAGSLRVEALKPYRITFR
jgi:predicted GNAT family N-acyltransferase